MVQYTRPGGHGSVVVPCSTLLSLYFSFNPLLPYKFYNCVSCFKFSSNLPAASAADAQPGSIVFLIQPTPFRVLQFNGNSGCLVAFLAMGSKNSNFFALASTVWMPPKPLHSLGVNTAPMVNDMTPSKRSPVPSSALPDIVDFGVLKSPMPTSSVS